MNKLATLLECITVMRKKLKPDQQPGYMHFRVFADEIRSAVEKKLVTWVQLGFSGEADLCQLELECLAYAMENHSRQAQSYEDWMKPALEAKLKLAQGRSLNAEERDNVVELFPEAEAA